MLGNMHIPIFIEGGNAWSQRVWQKYREYTLLATRGEREKEEKKKEGLFEKLG